MKIAFIIQDLFQLGAQYVTAMMIRGFIAKGYDVDLIVSKVHQDLLDKGDIKPFEIPGNTNIIILKDRKASKNISEIRKYLKSSDSRYIIAMSTNYNLALALACIGLRKKPKIAYVEHSGLAGYNLKTMSLSRPYWGSKNHIISTVLNNTFDTIMAVSAGTAKAVEYSMRRSPGSVAVTYNPVIDETYWEKLKSLTQNNWLKEKSVPTVVAAGSHSKIKNHLNLFEAIKIANKVTPVRLVLFGEGILTDQYKVWIEGNKMEEYISLAGQTSNLPAEIKCADAFIVSSNQESFSIVLVEALAAGVPVISTDCPYGPPEILQNGKYGKLIPVNNPQALANAIVKQIQNPKTAPKEAWEPYQLENIVASYERALGLI